MDTFDWITSNQQKVIFTNWKYYPLIKTTVTLSRRRVYFFFIFRVRFLGFRSRSRIIFSCKRSSEHFVNNLNLSCVCKLQLSTQIWHSTTRRPSLDPVFGLSHLGYCRNIVVQHGGLCGRGRFPSVDIKGDHSSNQLSGLPSINSRWNI